MSRRCPVCSGRMLAKQVCNEYWSYDFDENGDVELEDLKESYVVSTLKFVCSACGKLDTKIKPMED